MEETQSCQRGFSLVELIVVVAIMAVLVGILAPAYLSYVEKTRMGIDDNTAEEIRRAAEIVVLSGEYEVTQEVLVTFSADGVKVPEADYTVELEAELENLFGDLSSIVPVSKKRRTAVYTVVLKPTSDTEGLMIAGSWNGE